MTMILLFLSLTSFEDFFAEYRPSSQVIDTIGKAEFFSNEGRVNSRDSTIGKSVIQLKLATDWKGLFYVYRWYLNQYELPNKDFASKCVKDYYSQAQYLGLKEQIFYSSYLFSRLYFEKNSYDTAIRMGDEAVKYADLSENPKIKTLGLIVRANNEIVRNNESIAFDYLLTAKRKAEILKDTSLLIEAYDKYAKLYYQLEDFERSKQYRNEQLNLMTHKKNFDSLPLMGEQLKMAYVLNANKEFESCDKLLYELIAYSKRNKKKYLKDDVFQVMRSNLLDRDDFKGFVSLYKETFPDEMDSLRLRPNNNLYKIFAYDFENRLKLDSAIFYFELIKNNLLKNAPDKLTLANNLRRIGQFYFRNKQLDSARINLELALDNLADLQYIPYKLDCSKMLDSIYVLKKDFAKAYHYRSFSDNLLKEKSEATKKTHGLKIEFEHKEENERIVEAQSREKHNRQWAAIYSGLGFIICILFAILLSFISIKVKEIYVKLIGFISFIFLFEFIILYLDEKILKISEGNVLVNVFIKFLIAAILYLLHHIIEKRAIKYILTHKLILKKNEKQN